MGPRDFLCIFCAFILIFCVFPLLHWRSVQFQPSACYVRIIYDFVYQWLSGPHGKPGTWAQDMIIDCSWLSASREREKTQRGTSQTSQTQQGAVWGNKLLYLTFTYSNAFFEPQWGVLAFCQASIWPFFLILITILMKRIQRVLKQELILVLHQPLPWKAHHLNPWKRKQGQALT